ncbi:Eco47II family restriction endonuclease [Dyadobacter frigoris]|uniref:Eco47II family restriction endonuclease n=1 Tax=Dyadobacter frigoris TaxID=2576211 RepID=A0A4U6D2A4_9BACT|nr:Eco47II family restriction endonuclease [Dyadobacter frigoris]TKT91360.1 Eco47II family restriction endonuclease [Dyadobacter frigoris]
MALLKWITDRNLEEAVFNLSVQVEISENKINREFGKLFLDPFIAFTEMNVFNNEYDLWKEEVIKRHLQKDLSAHIINFYLQIILSYDKSDFYYSKSEKVLSSKNNKIIAYLGYKHKNNSGKKNKRVYKQLCYELYKSPSAKNHHNYKAFFVVAIPKKPVKFEVSFALSHKLTETIDPEKNVRVTDIVSFFQLITGDENAFRDLFNVLPQLFSIFSDGNVMTKEHDRLLRTYYRTYG